MSTINPTVRKRVKKTYRPAGILTLTIMGMMLVSACSKKGTPAPQPPPFTPEKSLLLGAKWTTTGAIVTQPDGTVQTWGPSSPNISGGAFLLSDVTFNSDGTAVESDYSSQPLLKWTLDGTTLTVKFDNPDGSYEGQTVTATVTKLDAHNLTLQETNVTLAITYPKVTQELTR